MEKPKGSVGFKKLNSEEKKNVGNANETKNINNNNNQNSEEAKKPQIEVIRSKKQILKKLFSIKLIDLTLSDIEFQNKPNAIEGEQNKSKKTLVFLEDSNFTNEKSFKKPESNNI